MFFHFFKSLIFQVFRGVRGQKKSLKWQKILSITLHISETIYNRLSSMVHMSKVIISPGIFFIFSKFWFSGSIGRWRNKKQSKRTKNYVCCAPYLRSHALYDFHLWYICKMMISPCIFFNVSKVSFYRLPGGEKEKTSQKWQTIFCVLPYISENLYHMIFIYGTHL